MQIERKDETFTLTQGELEEAYREKELEYRIQDAKNHVYEFCTINNCDENQWTENDIQEIAVCFLTHYDCNAFENALFNEIIDEIYRHKVVKNDVKFTIA